jgi:hypothetical protein
MRQIGHARDAEEAFEKKVGSKFEVKFCRTLEEGRTSGEKSARKNAVPRHSK